MPVCEMCENKVGSTSNKGLCKSCALDRAMENIDQQLDKVE